MTQNSPALKSKQSLGYGGERIRLRPITEVMNSVRSILMLLVIAFFIAIVLFILSPIFYLIAFLMSL